MCRGSWKGLDNNDPVKFLELTLAVRRFRVLFKNVCRGLIMWSGLGTRS